MKTEENDYAAVSIILASGAGPKRLGIAGEEGFIGRGVSYCAICDAPLFRQREVLIVGGGNAACEEALYLSKFAAKVTLIHRRDRLRADKVLQVRLKADPKIDFQWSTIVDEIEGENLVERLKLHDVKTGEKSTLEVSGVFISVGLRPNTDYLGDILPLDDAGHIITNENMETEIPGIFAAGDIRHNSARQAICAAGDGATAALYAEKFISE